MLPRILPFLLAAPLALLVATPSRSEGRDELATRLGRLPRALVECQKTDAQIVEALVKAAMDRAPTDTEMKAGSDHIARARDREEASRDLLWALISTREFMAKHNLTFAELNDFSQKVIEVGKKK